MTTTKSPTRLDESPGGTLRMNLPTLVNALVRRLLDQNLGAEAVTTRPDALTRTPVEVPAPAEALRVAMLVSRYGLALVYRYTGELRGCGSTWAQIHPLLDLPPEPDVSPAVQAFEYTLGPDEPGGFAFDARYMSWTCHTCGEQIRDFGPYDGHPDNCEQGHADGCQRHLDEIDTYQREAEQR